MNTRELKFPDWQAPLQDLMLEFDQDKLTQKLQVVEALIFDRLQRPVQSGDDRIEREALNGALPILRIIKSDRLGYPDWK